MKRMAAFGIPGSRASTSCVTTPPYLSAYAGSLMPGYSSELNHWRPCLASELS